MSNDRDDTTWESAMSRDFDARVRDLNEAPLDLDSVKGKAMTIRRNRRVGAAVGVLAAAAVIVPVAAIAAGNGSTVHSEPPVATSDPSPSPTEAVDPGTGGVDYVLGDTWHRSDGTDVTLPHEYDSAVLWDGQLVGTRYDGEAYEIADVIDGDGKVVDSFDTTGPVVENDMRSTIAWIDTDGTVMTRWPGGEYALGTVDLAAQGEGVAWTAAGITGGPDCHPNAHTCQVYLNSGLGEGSTVMQYDGTTSSPVDGALKFFDPANGGLSSDSGVFAVGVLTQVADGKTCGGLFDLQSDDFAWKTCKYQVQQISPDGKHVAAPPSYFDGLGPTTISVLDAADGHVTGQFAPEGGFIGTWAWSADGRLVFDTYDGASWHLMAMEPNGALTELTDPVKGSSDNGSPFTIVTD